MSIGKTLTKGKERIKNAFGKGDAAPADLATSKEEFLSAHAAAEKRVAEVRQLPGSVRNDGVKALVAEMVTLSADIKGLAEKATDLEEVEKQRLRLDEIFTAANKAEVAAKGSKKKLADFEKARSSARATLGEMRALPGAATDADVIRAIDLGEKRVAAATAAVADAVSKEEVKAQITELKGLSAHKDAAKTASDLYAKSAPKNLPDFEKKRKAASDKLAEVRAQPGLADDPTATELLQAADVILDESTTAARAAKSADDVTKQIEHLSGIEAKIKEIKVAAKDAQAQAKIDRKALPQWNKTLAEAEEAAGKLLEVRLGREEYKGLVKLIGQARLTLERDGAEAALAELSAYPRFVERTEAKQKKAKTQLPHGDIIKRTAAIEPFLKQLEQIAPKYAASGRREQADELIFSGGVDVLGAVDGLDKLLAIVQAEVADLGTAKADAERKLGEFRTEHQNLLGQGFKEEYFAVGLQMADQAENTHVSDREWVRADKTLTQAIKALADVTATQGQAKQDWEAGAAERKNMRELAKGLSHWPPLERKAIGILQPLFALEEKFKATGDYAACEAEYRALDFVQLKQDLEDARDAETTMPPADKLEDFAKKLQAAHKQVSEALSLTDYNLGALESKIKGLPDATATPLHQELRALRDQWQGIRDKPPGGDPMTLAKPIIDRAAGITKDVVELLKSPEKIATYQKDAQRADAGHADGGLGKEVRGMLDQLERGGAPVSSQRQRLAALLQPATSAEERADGLLALRDDLQGTLEVEQQKELGRVAQIKEAIERGVNKPLKKIDLPIMLSQFQGYQRDLEAEADDVSALADSDDPYFVKLARHETGALVHKVAAIVVDQGRADAVTYQAVQDELDALARGLGDKMKKSMPVTHAALKKDLIALTQQARRSSPKDGLALLGPIKKRIAEANLRLAAVTADNDAYKLRKDRLKKQWDQIKNDTRTRITDRTKSFEDAFDARLDEADLALKEENGAARATAKLTELEETLRAIEVSPDPRAELQKQDAKAEQEVEAVRDMARAFEADLKYFKDTVLKEAKKRIKERAAEGKSALDAAGDKIKGVADKVTVTNASRDNADQDLLDGLKTSVKSASKPVKPYLEMLSTLSTKAAKSPDLATARTAFQSARGILETAARTVDALKSVTSTTDLSVTKDLKQVEANWIAQAQNYTKNVQAMAAAIRESARDETDPEVLTAAEKAAKLVQRIATDFKPTAFGPEIAVLTKKDAPAADKLAAREAALTTMRAYRKILKNHPVHLRIANPKNPFVDGSKMRAAARGILVALKRIETETVVGV